MMRCLLYGAEGRPIGLPCESFDVNRDQILLGPQMCALPSDALCDLRIHLTCHHYRPTSVIDSNPFQFK